MKINRKRGRIQISGNTYAVAYEDARPAQLSVQFASGIGADLFVASGCDRDDGIDELIALKPPRVEQAGPQVTLTFVGQTTLWERVEYVFACDANRICYHYTVHGAGNLETVRFFEGFLQDDPRRADKFYPYFCGPGRHLAYHRPVKEFMQSSTPNFDRVYSFGINSADQREFGFYDQITIRVNGDRHYLGGDWLATPAPFLYLLGNRDRRNWVGCGLGVKQGEAGFMGYHYHGGEGFGLSVEYGGYTAVDGAWHSPTVILQETGADVFDALDAYVQTLGDLGWLPANDRRNLPAWWRGPIFGGWGEQVFNSNRWDNFFSGEHDDWSHDNVDRFCTQQAYEKMLATIERKGVNPTILIIDNRWFQSDAALDVATDLWPNLKGFIRAQHGKGRKVILWASPWSYCRCSKGKDVPIAEHMYVDEDELYDLEIDTDVFYPACKRAIRKARRKYALPAPTLTDANWRYTADPQNPAYVARVKAKIQYLLAPDGLDADGFEFDYTHFIPKYRGTKPITRRAAPTRWGVEALHHMIKLYYDAAKAAKPDALIISHTFNPYFNDVIDMLRLQDIYTDARSIVPQMEHRAKIAHRVAPGCVVHTDQHPMPSLAAWREYARFQPTIGNPCTYYVTGIETTRERFTEQDFRMLRKVWGAYERGLRKK